MKYFIFAQIYLLIKLAFWLSKMLFDFFFVIENNIFNN